MGEAPDRPGTARRHRDPSPTPPHRAARTRQGRPATDGPGCLNEGAWHTPHGVKLLHPTAARPYHRLDYYDAHGKRHQPSAGRECDTAWARAHEIDAQLAEGITPAGQVTIGQLLDEWLAWSKDHYTIRYHSDNTEYTNKYVRPALGHIPAVALRRADIKEVLDARSAVSMRRHVRDAIGSFLKWAEGEGKLGAASRAVLLPPVPRTARAARGRRVGEKAQFIEPFLRPSPDACHAAAEAMRQVGGARHGDRNWLMVAVAASTGVRIGELLELRKGDENPANHALRVSRALVRIKKPEEPIEVDGVTIFAHEGTALVTLPKWGRVRDTVLPERTLWGEDLAGPLTDWLDGLEPGQLWFAARDGTWLNESNFGRDAWGPAQEVMGRAWDERWTWHSFRHSFATALLDRGMRDTDVSNALGHKDTATTRAMYVGATAGGTSRLAGAF